MPKTFGITKKIKINDLLTRKNFDKHKHYTKQIINIRN